MRNVMCQLRFGASLLVTSALLLSAGTVAAQTPDVERNEDGGLPTIVVTAQKRAQRLIDVPLAIQAVDSVALQNQGVTRIEELQNVVPGLAVQYGQGGTLSPFLRGVGNALSGNYAENSVATYVDDVPRPRMRGSNALPDVERVEVLKGPQGALYGRNATGGAINIVTRNPGSSPEASATISYGSFDTLELQAYGSTPLSETVGINFSYAHRERDGTVKNLATNTTNPLRLSTAPAGFPAAGRSSDFDFESQNADVVTAKIRFAPSSAFSVTLRGDYSRLQDTQASGWIQRDPAVIAGLLSAYTGVFLTGVPVPLADFQYQGVPGKSAYADQAPVHDVEDYGGSLRIDADFGNVALTSISAYRQTTELASIDIDGTPIPIAGFSAYFRSKTYSSELRLTSTGDERFDWLVGAAYFKDKVNDATSGEIGAILAFPVPGTPDGMGGVNPLLPFSREDILSGNIPRFSLAPTIGRIDAESWAAFGQVSYEFTDAIELILSGRYTEERRKILFPAQVNTGNVAFGGQRKESAFTPAATLNYTLDSNGLIYLRYARGYKSGGLNNLLNPVARDVNGDPVGINAFKPEKLDAYEIGYKAELFDRRLRLTAAVYHYDYRNLQFQRVLSPEATSVVLNAQKARVNGAEIELQAQLADTITISGGLNYTDAKYKRFQVNDLAQFDASGNRMISAPKWSGQLTLDIDQPLTETLNLAASGTVAFKSSLYFDPENTVPNYQKSYALVNGRIGIKTADDRYGLYVFARNLFDKKYAQFGQTNSVGTVVNYGDRRIVGVTLSARFGN